MGLVFVISNSSSFRELTFSNFDTPAVQLSVERVACVHVTCELRFSCDERGDDERRDLLACVCPCVACGRTI